MIEYFQHLHHQTDHLPILVRYADLTQALDCLTKPEHDVLVVYGILGFPQREAGKILGVDKSTIGRRFWKAMDKLAELINENQRRSRE